MQIPPGSKTAIVNVSMPQTAATRAALGEMSAQLVWTLASTSYGARSIQAVKLEVNGRAWTPPGTASAVQDRGNYPQPALQTASRQDLYYLTSSGAARVLVGHGTASAPVPGQAGTSEIPLSSIAISPDQHYLAGVGQSAAGALYTSDLTAAAQPRATESARALQLRLTGMKISAVSWDDQDNLWVAGSIHGRRPCGCSRPAAAGRPRWPCPPGSSRSARCRSPRTGYGRR